MREEETPPPTHPLLGCVVAVLLILGWLAVLVFILSLADSAWERWGG